jgi:hypothetical protein
MARLGSGCGSGAILVRVAALDFSHQARRPLAFRFSADWQAFTCRIPDTGTVFEIRVFQVETAESVTVRANGKGNAMEIVYFIGAVILLAALIYGTLNYHYRDRRKDKVADQIVRDRYEHNRT